MDKNLEDYVDNLIRTHTRNIMPDIFALVIHDIRHVGLNKEDMEEAIEYVKTLIKKMV